MLCKEKGCKRQVRAGGLDCNTCHGRKVHQANPLKAAYRTLRGHAKQRHKEFTITVEEFTVLCFKTGYVEGKGWCKDALTIDRIDPQKGYSLDNMRVVTRSVNSKLERGSFTEEDMVYFPNNEECPF